MWKNISLITITSKPDPFPFDSLNNYSYFDINLPNLPDAMRGRILVFGVLICLLGSACKIANSMSRLRLDFLVNPNTKLLKEKSAITTNFKDHAQDQIAYLDDFSRPLEDYSDLQGLEVSEAGEYFLQPGIFHLNAKSYCIHAGTYNPGKGDGYVNAPLRGKRAKIIKSIVRNSISIDTISQQEIQLLIWSVLADKKFSEMRPTAQSTAVKVLSRQEIKELDGGLWGAIPQEMKQSLLRSLPEDLRALFVATENFRRTLSATQSSFSQIEQAAVLNGAPNWGEEIKPTPAGRWSFHPNGFFIRYFPRSYKNCRVEVYVPASRQMEFDNQNRISKLKINPFQEIHVEYQQSYNVHHSGIETISLADSLTNWKSVMYCDSSGENRFSAANRISLLKWNALISIFPTKDFRERIQSIQTLSLVLKQSSQDNPASEILIGAIKDAEYALVSRELRSFHVPKIRKQNVGQNIRWFSSSENEWSPIIYDPIGNVVTPARTSKQRLLVSPAPVATDHEHQDDKFEVRFYAYPSGTQYTKPTGEIYESQSGHAFVGFFKNGKLEVAKGMDYGNMGPFGILSLLVPHRPVYILQNDGEIKFGQVVNNDHLIGIPGKIEYRTKVSKAQYFRAKNYEMGIYFLVFRDCVTYTARIAEILDLNTPSSYNFIAWPTTYVQYLIDNN